MAREIEQIICEYRTMFEDVAKTAPNVRPADDVLYTSMDYGKILQEMCAFLEGYISYKDEGKTDYDGKVITSTKKYYDTMFANSGVDDPYRHQITMADMGTVNESFIQGTQRLKMVMETMMEKHPDLESESLITMSRNQYNKLAKVYRDDMQLYLWLATKSSKVNPKCAPIKDRVNFWDVNTPVMHRLDQYPK